MAEVTGKSVNSPERKQTHSPRPEKSLCQITIFFSVASDWLRRHHPGLDWLEPAANSFRQGALSSSLEGMGLSSLELEFAACRRER